MSASELNRNYTTRFCTFAIDSAGDIDMLPTSVRTGSGDLIRSTTCCKGSVARAVDGKTYVLDGNDAWVEYKRSGGGGGGGGDDVEPIPDSQIDDLFPDI